MQFSPLSSNTYNTVAAGQSTQVLGPVGATGDYLDTVTLIPATATAAGSAIIDGSTTVISTTTAIGYPVGNVVTIPVKAYSKTGPWKITTGANTTAFATGKFS